MIPTRARKNKFYYLNATLVTLTYVAMCAAIWHQSNAPWLTGVVTAIATPMLVQVMYLARRIGEIGDVYTARIIISSMCWMQVLLNIMTSANTSLFSPASIVMTAATAVVIMLGLRYYRVVINRRGTK